MARIFSLLYALFVAVCCECGNEPLGTIKCGEILD